MFSGLYEFQVNSLQTLQSSHPIWLDQSG